MSGIPDYHEGGFVNVPGLGDAYVTAGVDFFAVRFGPEHVNTAGNKDAPAVTINGKLYERVSVDVRTDGTVIACHASWWTGELTPAAEKTIRAAVEMWARDWTSTAYATSMMRPTIDRHNAINRARLHEDIATATNHLRELEMMDQRFDAAEPGEYVNTHDTAHRIVER